MANEEVRMFICYARDDKNSYIPEFLKRLTKIKNSQPGFDWHWDEQMKAGALVDETLLDKYIKDSDLACLLVSPDFLISKYINDKELPLIAERIEQDRIEAIPIILRETEDWQNHRIGNRKLGDLNALPEGGKHLKHRDWDGDADRYWNAIQKKLEEKIRSLLPGSVVKDSLPTLHFRLVRKGDRVQASCQSYSGFPKIKPETVWKDFEQALDAEDFDCLYRALFKHEGIDCFAEFFTASGIHEPAKNPHDRACRIILRSDDERLANLPWLAMTYDNRPLVKSGWVITVLPDSGPEFAPEISRPIYNALLLGSHESEPEIQSNIHLTLVESLVERNFTDEVFRPLNYEEIRNYFERGQPLDFLYVYAPIDAAGNLEVDEKECLPLETLLGFLNDTESRPFIVLALLIREGTDRSEAEIIAQCSRLKKAGITVVVELYRRETPGGTEPFRKKWIEFFDRLEPENRDCGPAICAQANKSTRFWQSNPLVSLTRTTDDEQKILFSIRVTLLRILLGREEEKNLIFSNVLESSRHAYRDNLLTYCVVGRDADCPHNFPRQIDDRIRQTDIDSPLLHRVVYRSLKLDGHEPGPAIRKALRDLRIGFDQDYTTFLEAMIPGLAPRDSACVSIAWLLDLSDEIDSLGAVKTWFEQWRDIHQSEFKGAIPPNFVVLAGCCLRYDGKRFGYPDLADTCNAALNKEDPSDQRLPITIREPLGALKNRDIRRFFRYTKVGRLFVDNSDGVDADDVEKLAEWLIQEHNGDFLPTVDLLWKNFHARFRQFKKWREQS